MPEKSLYELLGIDRSATAQQIKDAYKKAARTHHPDKGGNEETFKMLQRAYEVLSDEGKRRTYDLTGSADANDVSPDIHFPFPMDIGAMFGMFSGGPKRRQKAEKAPPKVERVSLSLAQFYKGHTFQLKFERQKFCGGCKGSGHTRRDTCGGCGGSGQRSQTIVMGGMVMQTVGPCDACSGEGSVGKDSCTNCKGTGRLAEEKVLDVVVAAGTPTGEVLKFESVCSDSAEYAVAGDLHIVLEEVEDEFGWARKGQHLEYFVQIGLGEALVGKKLTLEGHPKGGSVSAELPAGVQNGERLMFAGHGMSGGNLYITVQVQPKKGEREKLRDEARGYLASLFGISI